MRGTGSRVRDQIERDLSTEADSLEARLTAPWPRRTSLGDRSPGTPLDRLRARLRAVLALVRGGRTRAPGSPPTSPSFSASPERPRGPRSPPRIGGGKRTRLETIRDAPLGLSTVHLEDAGDVLLLKRAVAVRGDSPATITVGQPLAPCRSGPGGPREDLPDRRLAHGRRGPARGRVRRGAHLLSASSHGRGRQRGGRGRPLRPDARGRGAGEVQQLAESFNRMLDRLEDAFARQRGFVSDASHELRTPADRDPGPDRGPRPLEVAVTRGGRCHRRGGES